MMLQFLEFCLNVSGINSQTNWEVWHRGAFYIKHEHNVVIIAYLVPLKSY